MVTPGTAAMGTPLTSLIYGGVCDSDCLDLAA